MQIRKYNECDKLALREITATCFDGVCIDQNIEKKFGCQNGKGWQWMKKLDVENDIAANPEGIFIAEKDREVIGYISTRINPNTKVGRIANFAVSPGLQGKGVGRKLAEAALAYFKRKGMKIARIETLEQNAIGKSFYPKLGFKKVASQIHYAMPIKA